jgi:hypothetical protein
MNAFGSLYLDGWRQVVGIIEGLNMPPGEVVWRRDNLAGIEIFEELSWTSIIPWVRTVVRKS